MIEVTQRRRLAVIAIAALAVLVACGSGSTTSGTSAGTSGGTTTGTSSGSSTSGAIDQTACTPSDAGAQAELTECNFNVDCACPASCLLDPVRATIEANAGFPNPSGKYCEVSCGATSDCDVPSTVCKRGTCVEVPCGGLADGGSESEFGYVCNAIGVDDGTCFGNQIELLSADGVAVATASRIASGIPEACWPAGTSTASCSVLAPPADAADRCLAGQACISDLPGFFSFQGSCLRTCDPSATPPANAPRCDAGAKCVRLPPAGGEFVDSYGVCVAAGAGCLAGVPSGQTELEGCYDDTYCACPEHCVPLPADAGAQAGRPPGLCELSCASALDCHNPETSCIGGQCVPAPCSGLRCSPAAGAMDGGTCLSPAFSWFMTTPFCVQAGVVPQGAGCNPLEPQDIAGGFTSAFQAQSLPTVPALTPTQLCAPGLVCVTQTTDGGSLCEAACQSNVDCDGGLTCVEVDSEGFGFCGLCLQPASPCIQNGQCCSGSCSETSMTCG